jgi:hypothetical protein
MKGIQNKKFIPQKLIAYTYPVYVIGKENSESLFSCPAYTPAPAGDLW